MRCVRSLLKIEATGRFGALLLVFAAPAFGSVSQTSKYDVPGHETAIFEPSVGGAKSLVSWAMAAIRLDLTAVKRRIGCKTSGYL